MPVKPERVDFKSEGVNFEPEWANFRSEGDNFRSERADFRPERAGGGQTNRRNDKRKSPCVLQDFVTFGTAARSAMMGNK